MSDERIDLMDRLRISVLQEQVAALESQLAAERARQLEFQDSANEWMGSSDRWRARADKAEVEVASLKRELEQAREQRFDMNDTAAVLRADLAALTAERDALRDKLRGVYPLVKRSFVNPVPDERGRRYTDVPPSAMVRIKGELRDYIETALNPPAAAQPRAKEEPK